MLIYLLVFQWELYPRRFPASPVHKVLTSVFSTITHWRPPPFSRCKPQRTRQEWFRDRTHLGEINDDAVQTLRSSRSRVACDRTEALEEFERAESTTSTWGTEESQHWWGMNTNGSHITMARNSWSKVEYVSCESVETPKYCCYEATEFNSLKGCATHSPFTGHCGTHLKAYLVYAMTWAVQSGTNRPS